MQCAATTGAKRTQRERTRRRRHVCVIKICWTTLREASARAAHGPARPGSRESTHAPAKYLEIQGHEPARADFRIGKAYGASWGLSHVDFHCTSVPYDVPQPRVGEI
eukprot:1210620-Prymnesium_polylepis.1